MRITKCDRCAQECDPCYVLERVGGAMRFGGGPNRLEFCSAECMRAFMDQEHATRERSRRAIESALKEKEKR